MSGERRENTEETLDKLRHSAPITQKRIDLSELHLMQRRRWGV